MGSTKCIVSARGNDFSSPVRKCYVWLSYRFHPGNKMDVFAMQMWCVTALNELSNRENLLFPAVQKRSILSPIRDLSK